jgi:hypothetical protein
MKPEAKGTETWADELRRGLAAVADLGDEQPPDLAALQLLVARVRAEQRRELRRDLLRFWGLAVLVLTGALVVVSRQPAWFLVGQALLAGVLLAVGVLAIFQGKRVVE